MGCLLSPGGHHGGSITNVELDERPHEKGGSLRRCIKQRSRHVRSTGKEGYAGQAAPRTKINESSSVAWDQRQVTAGMLEVDAQRARTEETHGPSPFENGEQLFVSRQWLLFLVRSVVMIRDVVFCGRHIRHDDDIATGISTR